LYGRMIQQVIQAMSCLRRKSPVYQ
jgi:hypothetical protein